MQPTKDQLECCLKLGFSQNEMAEKFAISRPTVNKLLIKFGIKPTFIAPSPDQLQLDCGSGLLQVEIAEKYDISRAYVCKLLKKYNLNTPEYQEKCNQRVGYIYTKLPTKEQLQVDCEAGLTQPQIAEKYNIDRTTVNRQLKNFNLETQDYHKNPEYQESIKERYTSEYKDKLSNTTKDLWQDQKFRENVVAGQEVAYKKEFDNFRNDDSVKNIALKIPYSECKNIIYALIDPFENQIRYIGMTTKGLNRLRGHMHLASLKKHTHKNLWIRSLIKRGMKPLLIILDEFPDDIAHNILYTAEQETIKYYREIGCNLTNLTDGGPGIVGYKHTNEIKDKLAALATGYKHTEESKLKMSMAATGNKNAVGHKLTLEQMQKLREGSRAYFIRRKQEKSNT